MVTNKEFREVKDCLRQKDRRIEKLEERWNKFKFSITCVVLVLLYGGWTYVLWYIHSKLPLAVLNSIESDGTIRFVDVVDLSQVNMFPRLEFDFAMVFIMLIGYVITMVGLLSH